MDHAARILTCCGLLLGGTQGCLAPNGAWDPRGTGGETGGGVTGDVMTGASGPSSQTSTDSDPTSGAADWWDQAWSARVRISWRGLALPASAFPMPVRLDSTGIDYALYADTTLIDETWHHVVGVYDGAEMRLFIDGELQPTTMSRTGPIDPSTSPLRLGGESETDYAYAGALDELRVSNVPADPTYIAAQYRVVTEDLLQFSPD